MQSGKNGGNAGGVELFAALVGGVGDVAVTCRTTGNSEAFGAYLQAVAKFVDRACDSGGICCGDSGTDSGCWYGQCYARAGELAQQVGFVGGDKLGIEFGGNLGSDGFSGRTERVSRDVGGDSGSGLQSDVLGHGDVARGGVAAVVGGDVGAIRGKNYARNQKKRASRKARIERKSAGADLGVQDDVVREGAVPWRSARVARVKSNELARGHFSDLPVDDQRALKESYAKRLRAENELKMFKAQQQLELEKAKDLTQLKKRQETHIMRQTEVNKVQVERAFASLARTGNVPGVVGSVETVVTDGSSSASPVFSGVGSGTISPNSSISLAEIRAIQKDALDKAQEIEKLKRRMNRLLDAMPHLKGHAFADPEAPETVDTGVTVDSNGFPIGEFGDGYDGGIREDGKWHFGQDIY